MQHRTIIGLGGADEAQPAQHLVATEACIQRGVMTQAIEDRQHRGVGADGRGNRVDGAVQVVGLAAEDHQIERTRVRELRQCIGSDVGDRERRITQRTADHQAIAIQLRGAVGPHQERHIDTGLRQATTEITAGATGAKNQNTHLWGVPFNKRVRTHHSE
ncbi:hypothetical protein D3C81_1188190 [compost metagenome]